MALVESKFRISGKSLTAVGQGKKTGEEVVTVNTDNYFEGFCSKARFHISGIKRLSNYRNGLETRSQSRKTFPKHRFCFQVFTFYLIMYCFNYIKYGSQCVTSICINEAKEDLRG